MDRTFVPGDIVCHFKRQWANEKTTKYLYRIMTVAYHTETEEKLVVYEALYEPFKICARPYDMFCSKVDKIKYPDAKQEYRFEKYNG